MRLSGSLTSRALTGTSQSDICIMDDLRPVIGLPGLGIDNGSPMLSAAGWCLI